MDTPRPRFEIRKREGARHYPFVVYDNQLRQVVSVDENLDQAERALELSAALIGS